jgi:hypothetical protein
MNSTQYEELCRFFLADKLKIGIENITSVLMPNPQRANLPEYKHQIDLYWETGNDVTAYLNIANAKWRSSTKVDQPDVLLLQQVKLKVAAHKAVMITNSDFTTGARAAAQDEGIALHIVKPTFDYSSLSKRDREVIQETIQRMAKSSDRLVYVHETHFKAIEVNASRFLAEIAPSLNLASDQEKFMVSALSRRLKYLEMIIDRINAGTYGDKDDIPKLNLEVDKTKKIISSIIANINKSGS